MIKTSRQLKDKIKNLTHGDSLKSQTLLRTYMMERFLERLAVSQYNSHFVLKGGMLVSSMVGILKILLTAFQMFWIELNPSIVFSATVTHHGNCQRKICFDFFCQFCIV